MKSKGRYWDFALKIYLLQRGLLMKCYYVLYQVTSFSMLATFSTFCWNRADSFVLMIIKCFIDNILLLSSWEMYILENSVYYLFRHLEWNIFESSETLVVQVFMWNYLFFWPQNLRFMEILYLISSFIWMHQNCSKLILHDGLFSPMFTNNYQYYQFIIL